uniref:Uncharacterized protein n=1 Tax=Romanomermis culicivorax TaxID=13658 RepID=A0A915HLW6_ROMCU
MFFKATAFFFIICSFFCAATSLPPMFDEVTADDPDVVLTAVRITPLDDMEVFDAGCVIVDDLCCTANLLKPIKPVVADSPLGVLTTAALALAFDPNDVDNIEGECTAALGFDADAMLVRPTNNKLNKV